MANHPYKHKVLHGIGIFLKSAPKAAYYFANVQVFVVYLCSKLENI